MELNKMTDDLHSNVRRRLLAYMETGRFSEARTLLTEYAEETPEKARILRADIAAAYGVDL